MTTNTRGSLILAATASVLVCGLYLYWRVPAARQSAAPPPRETDIAAATVDPPTVPAEDSSVASPVPLAPPERPEASRWASLADTNTPSWEAIALVQSATQADEADLIALYRATPLTRRLSVLWALGQVGGDASARVLIHSLTVEFTNHRFSQEEHGMLGWVFLTLGIVSGRSELAYEFLTRHWTPESWAGLGWSFVDVPWVDRRPSWASRSILATGMSGRPEAAERFARLGADITAGRAEDSVGALVSGVFYLDLVTQEGAEKLWMLSMTRNIDHAFMRWAEKTTNGIAWCTWSDGIRKRSKPVK